MREGREVIVKHGPVEYNSRDVQGGREREERMKAVGGGRGASCLCSGGRYRGEKCGYGRLWSRNKEMRGRRLHSYELECLTVVFCY